MIIAKVDLRIVADNREQVADELNRIQARDRTYVHGWVESHYEDGRVPRGNVARNAVLVVKAKLLETEEANSGPGGGTNG